jgi:hypothetical protein
MTLEERIEELESRMDQLAKRQNIRTETIDLVDSNGNLRGVISGTWLRLLDDYGHRRVEVSLGIDGPGLFVYDGNNMLRASLSVHEDEPRLSFYDEKQSPVLSIP